MRFSKAISGIFFASAAAVLIFGKQGMLNLPGIGAALAALIMLHFNSFWSMALGLTAAAVSFAAQAYMGICSSCTLAASFFALGGISLYQEWIEKQSIKTLVFALPLVISLGAFVYNNPVQTLAVNAVKSQPVCEEKAYLYYSPLCSHCHEVLGEMIKFDPEGKTWTPVVIPANLAVQEKHSLKKKGYSGPITSAWKSPSGALPCLVVGNEIYQGSNAVQKYLRKKGSF